MATNIICLSDLHGHLPSNLPKADILLIAGDICPVFDHTLRFQENWLATNFTLWCKETLKTIGSIVYIAGNHDFFFEKSGFKPKTFNGWETRSNSPYIMNNVYYLQDEGIELNGLKIWGTPHQKRFYDWAFNLDEPELAKKWQLIPPDADIIMCHGPAYGYGDAVSVPQKDDTKWPYENVGSPSMLKRIDEIQPKLYCSGHIHSGRGIYKHRNTIIVNASYVNEKYQPVKEKHIIITI